MSRRDHNAEATRSEILAAGHEIFSQHPYSDVSGVQICDRAGVTRGALQHHFGSKLGLFMAVFEGLQQDVYLRAVEAIRNEHEPWERIRAGIGAFLDACTEPPYQMVVLQEGPAAIGWARWRELDTGCYADLTQQFAAMLTPTGTGDRASTMLVATMRGTLTELSFAIAQSARPASARQEAMAVIEMLLRSYHTAPASSPTRAPIRVGSGQLHATTSTYLERAAAGQTFDVTRRGRVMARLQRPTC